MITDQKKYLPLYDYNDWCCVIRVANHTLKKKKNSELRKKNVRLHELKTDALCLCSFTSSKVKSHRAEDVVFTIVYTRSLLVLDANLLPVGGAAL